MPTWEELKAMAGVVITNLLKEHGRVPAKGSYNKLLGKYGTDQRTVVQAATKQLQLINQISQMLYEKDIISFPDDEVKLPKFTIND